MCNRLALPQTKAWGLKITTRTRATLELSAKCTRSWRETTLSELPKCTPFLGNTLQETSPNERLRLFPFHHHQIEVIIRHRRIREAELATDGHYLASVVGAVVKNLMDEFKASLRTLHPRRVEAHRLLQTGIVERLDEGGEGFGVLYEAFERFFGRALERLEAERCGRGGLLDHAEPETLRIPDMLYGCLETGEAGGRFLIEELFGLLTQVVYKGLIGPLVVDGHVVYEGRQDGGVHLGGGFDFGCHIREGLISGCCDLLYKETQGQ